MSRKTTRTLGAAILAAGMLAGPIVTPGSGHGSERAMMGPGMMGQGGMMRQDMMNMMDMMREMSAMMESCQQMMQAMMGDHDGHRPDEQRRRPEGQPAEPQD